MASSQDHGHEPSSSALKLADLAVRAGRRVWRVLPKRIRRELEDRAFFVIFQKTRVENDAYGWRPPDAVSPTSGTREEPE